MDSEKNEILKCFIPPCVSQINNVLLDEDSIYEYIFTHWTQDGVTNTQNMQESNVNEEPASKELYTSEFQENL